MAKALKGPKAASETAVRWFCRLLAECPYVVADMPPDETDHLPIGGDPDAWRVGRDPRRPWVPTVEAGPPVLLELKGIRYSNAESLLIALSIYRWVASYQTLIKDGHEIAATLRRLLRMDAPEPRGEVLYEAPDQAATAPLTARRPVESIPARDEPVTPPRPEDALFAWMCKLVCHLPVLRGTVPEPLLHDDVLSGEQIDVEEIAHLMARARDEAPDHPVGALWEACHAWLSDVERVVSTGYALCHRIGVVLGKLEAAPSAGSGEENRPIARTPIEPPPPGHPGRPVLPSRGALAIGCISAVAGAALMTLILWPTNTNHRRQATLPNMGNIPVVELGEPYESCDTSAAPAGAALSRGDISNGEERVARPTWRRRATARLGDEVDRIVVERANNLSPVVISLGSNSEDMASDSSLMRRTQRIQASQYTVGNLVLETDNGTQIVLEKLETR